MKIKMILPALTEAKSHYWRVKHFAYAGGWKKSKSMKTPLRSDQLTVAGLLLAVPVVFFISILNHEVSEGHKRRSEPPAAQSYAAEINIPGQFLISRMLCKI